MLGCLFRPLGIAILLSLIFPLVSFGADLSGMVYFDRDANGAFATGDLGIRFDLIQLYDQSLKLVSQTYTDEYGRYGFLGLNDGTYTVVNTHPSEAGNSANVGQMLNSQGNLLVGTFGTPNSALVQISNISLTNGNKAINYDFGNDSYPLSLYSKYFLVADNGFKEGKPTPVPEPRMYIQLLMLAGPSLGWFLLRRKDRAGSHPSHLDFDSWL
jgi:hypothetical protein